MIATEVMPQLLMWVTLIKMVEMTVIAAEFRACGFLTCQDWSVFQTSYYSYRSRYRDIEEDLS